MKTVLFCLLAACCFSCGDNFNALQTSFPEDASSVESPTPSTLDKLSELLHDPIFHPKPCLP